MLLGFVCLPIAGARYPKGPGSLSPHRQGPPPFPGNERLLMISRKLALPAAVLARRRAPVASTPGRSDSFRQFPRLPRLGRSRTSQTFEVLGRVSRRPDWHLGFYCRTCTRLGHVSTTQQLRLRPHPDTRPCACRSDYPCNSYTWIMTSPAHPKPGASSNEPHLPNGPGPSEASFPAAFPAPAGRLARPSIRRKTICRHLVAIQGCLLTEPPRPSGILRWKGTRNVRRDQ
jgi:hypothetical protein